MGLTALKADYAGHDLALREVVITPDTAAYSSGDCIGGAIQIEDIFSDGEGAYLCGFELYEKKGSGALQRGTIYIYLIKKEITVADNAAFSFSSPAISASDVALVGEISNYNDIGSTHSVAVSLKDFGGTFDPMRIYGIPMTKAQSAQNNSLWLVLQNQSGGSITYTTGAELCLKLHFRRN